MRQGFVRLSAAVAVSLGGAAVLAAQEPARLAFGYQCDNKFTLRNEGKSAVDVEYGVVGTADKGKVRVEPDRGVSLETTTPGDLEIRVGGKVVATGRNGRVACAAESQSPAVIVRPLNEPEVVTVVEPYYPYYPYYYGGYPVYYGGPMRYASPRVGVYFGFGVGGRWHGGRGHGRRR